MMDTIALKPLPVKVTTDLNRASELVRTFQGLPRPAGKGDLLYVVSKKQRKGLIFSRFRKTRVITLFKKVIITQVRASKSRNCLIFTFLTDKNYMLFLFPVLKSEQIVAITKMKNQKGG
jgi:hypothetical protein